MQDECKSLTAEAVIQLLKLSELPVEGGMFRQTYLAAHHCLVEGDKPGQQDEISAGSAIFYLLQAHTCSQLHRLKYDEMYHFYLGEPVELTLLHPDGRYQQVILGQDLLAGQSVQFLVPANVWQGSRIFTKKNWSMLGTTMSPAYRDEDFEIGRRAELLRQYPEAAEAIHALTSPEA